MYLPLLRQYSISAGLTCWEDKMFVRNSEINLKSPIVFIKSPLTAMAYQIEHNHFPAVDPLDASRVKKTRETTIFFLVHFHKNQRRHLYIKGHPKGDSYTW